MQDVIYVYVYGESFVLYIRLFFKNIERKQVESECGLIVGRIILIDSTWIFFLLIGVDGLNVYWREWYVVFYSGRNDFQILQFEK